LLTNAIASSPHTHLVNSVPRKNGDAPCSIEASVSSHMDRCYFTG
jgi:hypothetical protein